VLPLLEAGGPRRVLAAIQPLLLILLLILILLLVVVVVLLLVLLLLQQQCSSCCLPLPPAHLARHRLLKPPRLQLPLHPATAAAAAAARRRRLDLMPRAAEQGVLCRRGAAGLQPAGAGWVLGASNGTFNHIHAAAAAASAADRTAR
jgi:hypothetical protein